MGLSNSCIKIVCLAVLALGLATGAVHAAEPQDAVREHFRAISAEDYAAADQYLSTAFRRAFKGDLAAMDRYYIMRLAQLRAGYSITAVEPLADPDKECVRVTVDFNDGRPDSAVLVSERLHYYLLREKENAGPLIDPDGRAWRIDIFDALAYDTLAEARRRPYLYTREAWPEDEGRELKAQQGLFRVQQALESFKRVTGQYPLRLLGADNRRDELISAKYLIERYPPCGFDDRPMEHVEFGIRSSGDFSYYSLDRDGDGKLDGYWLLLHGKVPAHALFAGRDCILLLADGYRSAQPELAREFAQWWEESKHESVEPGPALGEDWDEGALPAAEANSPAPLAPEEVALDSPPLVLDSSAAAVETLEPSAAVLPAAAIQAEPAAIEAAPAESPAPRLRELPQPAQELIVHSWGF